MKTEQATIYTHIERDNRYHWHPVIVIKHRGMQVFAATSLRGYIDPAKAVQAATVEAKRLEKGQ